MKRGLLLVLLVFILPVVVALPPSFHLFSGYVSCNDTFVDGKSLTLEVFNLTYSEEYSASIVDGLYYVIIDSELGNEVNFSAGDTFLANHNYQPYGVDFELNFTVDSGDSFCASGDVVDNGGNGGGNGGGSGSSSGGGSYCGDGTCNTGEDCSNCVDDCGFCGGEYLNESVINLDEALTVEILTSAGDYTLIYGGEEFNFTIFNISDEYFQIDIFNNPHEILFGGAETFFIGDQEVQVSYLGKQGEKIRVAFSKISRREVTAYSLGNFIYYVVGVMVFAIIMFFIIRFVNKRKGRLAKPRLVSRVKT